MGCLDMYQILANNKIKCDQVLDLDLDDLKSMGIPLGDVIRFRENKDRRMTAAIAGNKKFKIY